MQRRINPLNGKITFINDQPSNPSPNQPVSEHLAAIIENAVRATNVSINVNSTSGGKHAPRSFHKFGFAVDINQINNKRIDDPSSANDVRRFQQFVSQHPDVAECFGPFINIRKRGTQVSQMPQLRAKHLNHLHISSQR